jgi:hypothetical protein
MEYLGLKLSNSFSLENISSVICYLIDTKVEIIQYKNFEIFRENLFFISQRLKLKNSPILIKTEKIYTLIGLDLTCETPELLILNHIYEGKNNLISLQKSSVCCWLNINEFITESLIEILLLNLEDQV